ncbi:MAG: DUF262 domain-containing protein [Desulfobaccales bacterium]
MAEPLFINEIISQIMNGNIRIPSFQRGFVWDADRVAHLMDSIYKGFPFGSLLFWRTKTALNTEKKLGPYKLPDRDPDYPIEYILDGQQRATSVFGVFQTSLSPDEGEDASFFDIYFDLTQEATVQDSNFIYVPQNEFDPEKHFPLKILFNPPEYRKFLLSMKEEIADKVDILYQKFTTARIPVQTFITDDRTAVAIVFERINRLGVELDTLQLLSAWTWNEEFDLQEEFSDLAEDLEPFGFKDVGEDSDLLLRCCSAIVAAEASPNTIINLNGKEVRERFGEIRKGILGAVDFLRTTVKAYSAEVLPFPSIIIPLSVFFATGNDQDTHPTAAQQVKLQAWVWRTFFSRRYSKRLEQLNYDIKEIKKLKNNQDTKLGDFEINLDHGFFINSQFNLGTTNTKTFVLMLANEGPLNFISGSPVQLESVLRKSNKKEFHHVCPKKFLLSETTLIKDINSLVNFVMLSKADNNKLGGNPPSVYRKIMKNNEEAIRLILKRSLCPEDIFHDDFSRFVKERTELLLNKAKELMMLP